MKKHLQLLDRARKQSGGSLIEYALILSLIAVVAILAIRGIGKNANTKLGPMNSNLSSSGGGENDYGGGHGDRDDDHRRRWQWPQR